MTVKGGTSQACAACKFQRRRCSSECVLAPYFPANNPDMFQNAHRLFGVSKITRILDQLDTKEQKDEAMKSVIFESEMRDRFPVTGCCGIISEYSRQYAQALDELRYVYARLAMCSREEESTHHNQNHQMVDHDQFPPTSELQLGMNPIGNELLQNHFAGNSMLPFDAGGQYVMNAHNNLVYVDQSNDDMTKQWWIQNPNYSSYHNNDHLAAMQSQIFATSPEAFPVQQETEVDYEAIPFDTIADDRQSYVESKEACQSSCQSS